jgi:hypothetical protein
VVSFDELAEVNIERDPDNSPVLGPLFEVSISRDARRDVHRASAPPDT